MSAISKLFEQSFVVWTPLDCVHTVYPSLLPMNSNSSHHRYDKTIVSENCAGTV